MATFAWVRPGQVARRATPVLAGAALRIVNGVLADVLTICFMAGTMIRTPTGEVAIETLSIGDLVEIGRRQLVGARHRCSEGRERIHVSMLHVAYGPWQRIRVNSQRDV